MNTPNKLTIFRILLIPVFLVFLYANWWSFAPLLVFVLAAITDFLDGYIARTKNLVTTFGKFADPLADKLLVTAALVAFVDLGYISGIIAIIVISREFIITGLRLVAISDNKVIAAGFWGKLKTILQIVTIIVILLIEPAVRIFMTDYGFNGPWIVLNFERFVLPWLVMPMTAITVISGFDYVWKSRKLLKMGGNE